MRTEGVFVEAHFRRTAGNVVDGENVKTDRRIVSMALCKESLRRPRYDVLLVSSDAMFGQSGQLRANRSSTRFDEHKRCIVISDQVQFAFRSTTWRVVARDKYVSKIA